MKPSVEVSIRSMSSWISAGIRTDEPKKKKKKKKKKCQQKSKNSLSTRENNKKLT